MEDDLRDWKVERILKAAGESHFDEIYEGAVAEYPDWLPLLRAKVRHVFQAKKEGWQKEVIELANAAVGKIDTDKIAMWNGTTHDLNDGEVDKQNKEIGKNLDILVECLECKCMATDDLESFTKAYEEVCKWTKVEGCDKKARLEVEMEKRMKRWGTVLKICKKVAGGSKGAKGTCQEFNKDDVRKAKVEALSELEWGWVRRHEETLKLLESQTFHEF